MKRALALLSATALAACAGDPDPAPVPKGLERVWVSPGLGQAAYDHAAALVEFGARHTGSPGWRSAIDYISGELRRHGIEPRLDTWTDPIEKVTFTNVIATLPGALPDRIVIGCHHDTKKTSGHPDEEHNFHFVGANDSGSGVGMLLALAAELRDRPRNATFEFVFFDGEESIPYDWDITRALFGSRRYVRMYDQARIDDPDTPPIRALVLLDMVGAKDLQIDEETDSDPLLREIIRLAAVACGHESYFFENSLAVTDDHTPFLGAGIPAIDLIDIYDNPQWHEPTDTIDTLAPESFQLVGEVVVTALPEIVRQFVLRMPGSVQTRPERSR